MATGGHSEYDPYYINRIFIEGIVPSIGLQELKRHLRRRFGEEPRDVILGTFENCIATFDHSVDTSPLPDSDTLDGHVLHFDKVPVSFCLQMSDVPRGLREDAIRRYFEGKNLPGGGEIANVLYSGGTAMITFRNHQDAEEVCRNGTLTIGSHRVHVRRYYEQLSESLVHVSGFSAEKSEFLHNRDDITKYVNTKIKENNLNGHWKIQNGEVNVNAINDEVGAKIAHLIKGSVIKAKISLDKQSLPLMDKESWSKTKERIRECCVNTVEFQLDRNRLELGILSTDQDGDTVKEFIKEYFENHTIYKTDLKLTTESMQQVQEQRKNSLARIKEELKPFHVDFAMDDGDLKLNVTGTESGVNRARIKVEEVVSNPVTTNRTVPATYSMDLIEKAAFVRRDLDLTITVMLGDITNLKVDALLNPTNKDLKHIGGLAKVIIEKGGTSIQTECTKYVQSFGGLEMSAVFCGTAGSLPCQNILHCCVPVWQGGQHSEGEDLREAVQNSLDEACNRKLQSIAIPALGSGVHGIPGRTSTETIVEAIKDFFDQPKPLKEVFLCDIKFESMDFFMQAVQTYFPESEVTLKTPWTWGAPKTESVRSLENLDVDSSGSSSTLLEFPTSQLPLHQSQDESFSTQSERFSLEQYQVEMLKRAGIMKALKNDNRQVNASLDSNKKCVMFTGPSQSVTRAKGQLSQLLKGIKKKEGPISPKKIKCIREKVTKQMIWDRLGERDISAVYWMDTNTKLIVYGLSDGDVVATFSIIQESVTEFTLDLTDENCNLARSQEFQDYLKQVEDILDSYMNVTIERKILVIVTFTMKKDSAKELIEQFFMGKTRTIKFTGSNTNEAINYPPLTEIANYDMKGYSVTLMEGNITDVLTKKDIDVIVNSMSINREGGLAREIFRKAGTDIEREIKDKIGNDEFQEGDLHITNGGDLRCQMIVNVFCRTWEEGRRQEKEHLSENVLSCLNRTNSLGLESIVFPPLGTGICAMPPSVSAKTIADAILDFFKRTPRPHVTKIYICCKEREHVKLFKSKLYDRFKEMLSPGQMSEKGVQPQKFMSELKLDQMEIDLSKFPETRRYIDGIIRKKVGKNYGLEYCRNGIKISAASMTVAESISAVFREYIVSQNIKSKNGMKVERTLERFKKVTFPGKFLFKINQEDVRICATLDVSENNELKNFLNQMFWCVIL